MITKGFIVVLSTCTLIVGFVLGVTVYSITGPPAANYTFAVPNATVNPDGSLRVPSPYNVTIIFHEVHNWGNYPLQILIQSYCVPQSGMLGSCDVASLVFVGTIVTNSSGYAVLNLKSPFQGGSPFPLSISGSGPPLYFGNEAILKDNGSWYPLLWLLGIAGLIIIAIGIVLYVLVDRKAEQIPASLVETQ